MLASTEASGNDGRRMVEPGPRLLRSSAVVSVGTLLSRVTGLVRVAVLGGVLGTSALADAYNTANGLPNIVYELVMGGVLSAALIPLFVRQLDDDDSDGISAILTTAIVSLAALTLLSVLAAPLITAVIAINKTDEVRQSLTTLLRWFLPQVFFYGVLALATALLQARRRYGLAAFAPAVNNIFSAAGLLLLPGLIDADLKGEGAIAAAQAHPAVYIVLGLATTGGVALSAAAVLPGFRVAGLRLRPNLTWRHPAVVELLRLSRWSGGHALVNQLDNLFVIAVALNLGDGPASAYAYAWLLWIVPHGLVAAALLTTLTPEFARFAQNDNVRGLRIAWAKGLRLTMLAMLPMSVGLAVAAYPLLRVMPFFSRDSADQVAGILTLIGPGLVSYSVFLYTLRVFYAFGDTRTPFWVNLVQNLVHVVLAIPLTWWLGAPGLGLLSTLAYSTGAVLGFAAAARRLGRVPVSAVKPVASMAAAALAMGVVVTAVLALLRWGGRDPSPLLELAACLVVGPPTYAAYLWVFRATDDAKELLARFRPAG